MVRSEYLGKFTPDQVPQFIPAGDKEDVCYYCGERKRGYNRNIEIRDQEGRKIRGLRSHVCHDCQDQRVKVW
jgi:hypothetical protein